VNQFAERLKEAAAAEAHRRRDAAWREAEAEGWPEAKALRLIATVEVFAELAEFLGITEDIREPLALAYAVLTCVGPPDETRTEAAALVAEADYGEPSLEEIEGVRRSPAFKAFHNAMRETLIRDPYDDDTEGCIAIFRLAVEAGCADPMEIDETPPRVKVTRLEGRGGLGVAR
jgi:hypothetical protein